MIIETDNTVFNVNADCIVNTINCDGFMGKGLALEFSLRYPRLNEIYKIQCKNKELKPGRIYFYNLDGNKIINFSTKDHFKFDSKYEWIENGLIEFSNKYKDYGIKSIAFPILGSSNGGLDKNRVTALMKKYLGDLDIIVYLCKSKLLNGKEKEMLDSFKTDNLVELSSILKLNKNQLSNLIENQKEIERFNEILNIPKIGVGTYTKIFNYYYKAENKYKKIEQIRLF